MTSPGPGPRRAARAARTAARRRRPATAAALIGGLIVAAVVLAFVPRAMTSTGAETPPRPAAEERPPVVTALPVPEFAHPLRAETPADATGICADAQVVAALAAGDDEAVIAAAGGGEAFRAAVAAGAAPCISLSDLTHRWVVVNKQRPLQPIDAAPAPLVAPGIATFEGGTLRQDAAEALTRLAADAGAAGAGEMAMLSGYRSAATQETTYAQHVRSTGQAVADLESARPGHSEHQTGITLDLVACGNGCGDLDGFAGSPQGQWVAEHAWEYGFIVRYVDGATDVTGYKAEPWHLRFVGPALARTYHDGGWRSLEEFFGLPAAPDYAG